MGNIEKIIKKLINICLFLSILCLLIIIALVSINIVLRAMGIQTITWVVEASQTLHIYAVFLGICVVYFEKRTIKMSAIREKLSLKYGYYLDIIIELTIMVFIIVLLRYSIQLEGFIRGQVSPLLGISVRWRVMPIIVFSLIVLIINVFEILKLINQIERVK